MILLTTILLFNFPPCTFTRALFSELSHQLFMGAQRSVIYSQWRRQTFYLGVLLLRLSRSKRTFGTSIVFLLASYGVDVWARREGGNGPNDDKVVSRQEVVVVAVMMTTL